jgi:hypothetical protein
VPTLAVTNNPSPAEPGCRSTFSAATFDPGDLWIDVMAYFLSDAGNPELAVSYSGNVIVQR